MIIYIHHLLFILLLVGITIGCYSPRVWHLWGIFLSVCIWEIIGTQILIRRINRRRNQLIQEWFSKLPKIKKDKDL